MMNLKNALKWSFLAELSTKIITPVCLIVLARLLTPEDYGVMTAAMMVIAFVQIFWEAGMAKALIQRSDDIDKSANITFWVNILLAFLLSLSLFFGALPISEFFFQDIRVASVLQVMTLQIIFGALASVQTALLKKEMEFKKLFWVRIITVSIPGLASIPLAMTGIGYWALVVGTISGQFVQMIMLWQMSRWRPSCSFQRSIAVPMIKFGFWVGISGLLSWFYIWADSLVIGNYLGSRDLGIYKVGNQFSGILFTLVLGPIIPVLYSYLSRIGGDRFKLTSTVEKLVKILTYISIPIGIIIYQYSLPLSNLFLGSQWQGISFVIGILALMHGFSWIVGMNGEFYRAMGKPSIETIVTAGTLLIYLSVYLLSIKQGFDVFVTARLFLALGTLFLHFFVLKKFLKVNLYKIFVRIVLTSLISFLISHSIFFALEYYQYNLMYQAILGPMLSAGVIGSIFVYFDRKFISCLLNDVSTAK